MLTGNSRVLDSFFFPKKFPGNFPAFNWIFVVCKKKRYFFLNKKWGFENFEHHRKFWTCNHFPCEKDFETFRTKNNVTNALSSLSLEQISFKNASPKGKHINDFLKKTKPYQSSSMLLYFCEIAYRFIPSSFFLSKNSRV